MLGPVADGGHIVWNSTPGCWGPMITPSIRGGHEVCQPVAVDGREARGRRGDPHQGHRGDLPRHLLGQRPADGGPLQRRPLLRAGLPGLRRRSGPRPASRASGRSRCAARPAARTARRSRSPTATRWRSTSCARSGSPCRARRPRASPARRPAIAALPDNSVQNPILGFAPHDIVALATRLRPFLGQIGTSPSTTIPDSHNAGDFGSFLIGAPHRYALDAQELQRHKTDGHMDIDAVRAGAILVCPVKLDGAGVYLGDMHALQGDGEIAGPHLRRVRHRDAAGRGPQGPRQRRPDPLPARGGPALPGPAAQRRRARAGAGARAPARHGRRSRSRSRSR